VHRSGPEREVAHRAYNPEVARDGLRSFHATGYTSTMIDHGSVEFAVHPPHQNELRTQLLDCGGGEGTLISIPVDPHFFAFCTDLASQAG
jgi:hypothetical protein